MISKMTPEKTKNNDPRQPPQYLRRRIPFMRGRPQRDGVINADDILNLVIACNTCSSLDDFIMHT